MRLVLHDVLAPQYSMLHFTSSVNQNLVNRTSLATTLLLS